MTTKILAALAAALLAGSADAGVLTYSGYLLDPQGKPVTTSTSISFRFYPGTSGGALIWEDVVTVLPNADGWFSAVIGAAAGNPLDAADFAQPLWLTLKVATDAQEMAPRMRIGTAPYALTVPWDGVQGKPAAYPVDPALVQSRITGTCGPGQFMTAVGESGTVTCGADATSGGDITGVGPGFGLLGGGVSGDVTLSVNSAAIQQRVAGTCAAGSSIRAIDAAGAVTCEADDDTTYSAGSGLVLAGAVLGADFAGSGSATTVARSDHSHAYVPYASGNASVSGDYAFTAAKTGWYSLSSLALIGDRVVRHTGFGEAYLAPGFTEAWVEWQVNLPQGAVVNQFSCRLMDNSATGWLTIQLKRHAGTAETTLATLATTAAGASASMQTLTTASITAPTVDNSAYAYYAIVYINGPANSDVVSINDCQIRYTVTRLAP